jgi:hypothetical protein
MPDTGNILARLVWQDEWMDEYRTAPEYRADKYRSPGGGRATSQAAAPHHQAHAHHNTSSHHYTSPGRSADLGESFGHTEEDLRAKIDVDYLLGEDSSTLAALLAEYRHKNKERLKAHAKMAGGGGADVSHHPGHARAARGGMDGVASAWESEIEMYHSEGEGVDWPSPEASRRARMHSQGPKGGAREEARGFAREGAKGRARSAGPPSQRQLHYEPPHSGCAHFLGGHSAHGDNIPRPGGTSLPPPPASLPFSFDQRDKERPKSIMQERLEQELLIRADTEELELMHRFRATPVPASTREPRYMYLAEAAQFRRETNVLQRGAHMQAITKPFSFQQEVESGRAARAKEQAKERLKRDAIARTFRAKQVRLEGVYRESIGGLVFFFFFFF